MNRSTFFATLLAPVVAVLSRLRPEPVFDRLADHEWPEWSAWPVFCGRCGGKRSIVTTSELGTHITVGPCPVCSPPVCERCGGRGVVLEEHSYTGLACLSESNYLPVSSGPEIIERPCPACSCRTCGGTGRVPGVVDIERDADGGSVYYTGSKRCPECSHPIEPACPCRACSISIYGEPHVVDLTPAYRGEKLNG